MRAQLKAALPDQKSLKESIIVIAVDLVRPWSVIQSLERWVKEIKVNASLLSIRAISSALSLIAMNGSG